MFRPKPNKNVKIETLIHAKTRIDGNVQFTGGMHVDGYINGNVSGEGNAGVLWVSDTGTIEGSVMVADIMLNGLVKGDIEASGRVELGEKGRVLGNVRYATIETAVGAQINGKLIHKAAGDGDTSPSGEPPL
jgi:cytoskeletal protein CcmA (bactofilin family)